MKQHSTRSFQLDWPRVLTVVLGIYLFLTFFLDKTFSYTFIWLGPIPIFITEVVLALLLGRYAILCLERKKLVGFDKNKVSFLFLLFWIPGLLALFELFFSEDLSFHALKRSALSYYSLFGFLIFALIHQKRFLTIILEWMFWGAIAATIMGFFEFWFPVSIDWPLSVGVARSGAQVYAFLYLIFRPIDQRSWIFNILAAISVSLVIFAGGRSNVIGVTFIIISLLTFAIVRRKMPLKNMAYILLCFILISPLFLFRSGLPSSINRFLTTFKVEKKETLPSVPASNAIVSNIKKAPKAMTPAKKTPMLKKPVKEIKASPTHLAKKEPVPIQASVPTATVKTETIQKRSPATAPLVLNKDPVKSNQGSVKPHVHPEKSKKVVEKEKKEDPTPSGPNWIEELMKKLENRIVLIEGNARWRIRVWKAALKAMWQKNPILGFGITDPLIIDELSPYTKKDRRDKTIKKYLELEYDFYARISDERKDPKDDIVPEFDLMMDKSELNDDASVYWYDMDLHNSHLAVLFRFGFLGFFSYVAIVIFVLVGLLKLSQKEVFPAVLLFSFIIWQLLAAFFNVVLEGPFMGVPFWVSIGLSLSFMNKSQELNNGNNG